MARTFQHQPDQALQQERMEAEDQRPDSQSQGMAIVGQVAGGILHDFNNILTVITGTIDILAQAVGDRPELAAVARLIDEAASRGVRLTAQLLAFSGGRTPRPCEVDIDELLTDVARLLRPTLGLEMEITATVAAGTPTAFADSGQLMAALLCLSIMARNALVDGGRLCFEAAAAEAAVDGTSGRAAGESVVIVLTASARAGQAQRPKRIFPDIAMVDDFVRRSNGCLKVGGDAAAGTRVEITLPRGDGLLA